MSFSETTKAVNAAKKQPRGVIKEVIDGVAALEKKKEKANGKGKEIEVEVLSIGGRPVEDEVMVQPVLTGTESGLPDLPESIRLLLPAYEETLVKRCKLSKLEGEKKKQIGSLMIAHKVKRVSLQNGSHLEWTTEDKIKHVPAPKEKKKKKKKG